MGGNGSYHLSSPEQPHKSRQSSVPRVTHRKGTYTYDVRKIFKLFDPLPLFAFGTVTILEGGECVKGFPTECGGINQGDIPRDGAPRDVPEVDPDTRGRNNPCARARTKVLALL